MLKKQSLTSTTFLVSAIILFILAVSLGYLWIEAEYQRLTHASDTFRAQYMDSQKLLIRNEVDRLVGYVSFQRSMTENRVRNSIRERVYEGYETAWRLHDLYKGKMPDPALKKLILETLRSMRYNNGRGYFYATSLSGTSELHSDRPEREGKNVLGLKDLNGKHFIRDMIRIAENRGEGFCEYTWTKPGQRGEAFPKIAFVRYFAPFDMLIGTGEYLDDVEEDIRKESLARIRRIAFGNDGYVFVQDMQGVFLSHPQEELLGRNAREFKDPYVRSIFEHLRKSSLVPGGRFVTYNWRKPSTGKVEPKLSYVRGFPEWGWVMVTGVYLDDVEKAIAERTAEDRNTIRSHILFISVLFLSFLAASLLIAWFFSRKIKKGVSAFIDFFRRTATTYRKIESEELSFSEFVTIGEYANKMVDDFRDSQTRLRTLYDSATDAIFTLKDKVFVECNQATLKMFGCTQEEIIGKGICDFSPPLQPDGRPSAEKEAENMRAILRGESLLFEWQHRRQDGTLFDTEVSISRIDLSGQEFAQAVVRDISERKRAEEEKSRLEEQLLQAQKLESLGRLAGGVAHDFNNMLTPIMGFSELLMETFPPDDPRRKDVEQIILSSERSRALVRQLLAFARRQTLEVKPADLNGVVTGFAKILRRTLHENVTVEIRNDPEPKMIRADIGQVEQIILNLAINAQDAMPEGGALLIETGKANLDEEYVRTREGLAPGPYVVLSMSDTGIGMEERTLENIFDPFYTTKGVGKGTGLGLATVYGIVTQHGGHITAESEPGRGSTFRVLFPEYEGTVAAAEPVQRERKAANGTETVLLVEDDSRVRSLTASMLKYFGYHVLEAWNGRSASDVFHSHPDRIDLLLTDVVLPDMTGKMVQELLSLSGREFKVLYMSGYSSEVISRHGILQEGVHFLQKPFRMGDLAVKIREALS